MIHRFALAMLLGGLCVPGFCAKKLKPALDCDFSVLNEVQQAGDSISDPLMIAFFASLKDTICMNDPDFIDKMNAMLFPLIERHTERALKAAELLADGPKSAFLRQLEAPQTYGKTETQALYDKIDSMDLERRWKKRLLLALQRAIDNYKDE